MKEVLDRIASIGNINATLRYRRNNDNRIEHLIYMSRIKI